MCIKKKIVSKLKNTVIGKRLLNEPEYRMISGAAVGFVINLMYALYNGALGIADQSLWFITMCAYYTILSTTRFSVILCERRNNKAVSAEMECFVMKLAGGLLAVLGFVLISVIYISMAENIAAKHETIVMITIAAYTFYKITMVIVRAVKHRKNPSLLLAVIRSISYADVSASVFTLQRSMSASFGEMNFIMDVLTGAAVCIFVFMLGLSLLIRGKRKGDKYAEVKTCKDQ